MNLRYLIPSALLIGIALWLIVRGNDDQAGREMIKSPLRESSETRPPGHSRGQSGDEKRSAIRSTRVPREKPEVVTTDSGLQYEILVEGEGEHPGPTDQVEVHYEGALEDGTVFDSSYERGNPAVLPLNAVIKGWTEGLQLMKPGGKYRFTIPPELAYGSKGHSKVIPANSTLVFEVELISVKHPGE